MRGQPGRPAGCGRAKRLLLRHYTGDQFAQNFA